MPGESAANRGRPSDWCSMGAGRLGLAKREAGCGDDNVDELGVSAREGITAGWKSAVLKNKGESAEMTHNKIEVTWEVADGYAEKSRQQTTRIRREEIESAIDEADVREIVEQSIQSDFESKIAPDYGESVYSEALAIWRQSQAEK
jgi:hypothetical protein